MERDRRGGYNRKKVNESFFKNWSAPMAYVLGFIYADGAIEDCRKSSRTCFVCLYNNDFELLKMIALTMNAEQTIQKRAPHKIIINGKDYMCKTSYFIRIGNINIYNDLTNLGLCPRKSLIINLPKIPDQYFNYFLRGYFDGDGCINIEKLNKRLRIIFTSGSRDFLFQLNTKIEYFLGILTSKIHFNDRSYKLTYGSKSAEKLVNFIYQDIASAPFLNYKHDKYIQYWN